MTVGRYAVFTTNTTDSHDITQMLLKMALLAHNLESYPYFCVQECLKVHWLS